MVISEYVSNNEHRTEVIRFFWVDAVQGLVSQDLPDEFSIIFSIRGLGNLDASMSVEQARQAPVMVIISVTNFISLIYLKYETLEI